MSRYNLSVPGFGGVHASTCFRVIKNSDGSERLELTDSDVMSAVRLGGARRGFQLGMDGWQLVEMDGRTTGYIRPETAQAVATLEDLPAHVREFLANESQEGRL